VYPLIARIISGGGTANLVLDHVLDHNSVNGVLIRHADAAVTSERPIQMENVDASGAWPQGGFFGADSSGVPVSITNTSHIRYCRLEGTWSGLTFNGSDANACGVWGADFSFCESYGVLDLSLIGNKYFGCHFAFNIGIANPRVSSTSAMFGCYFESGTSYIGNGNGCSAYGCDYVNNGNGWAVMANGGVGFNMPSITVNGTDGALTAAELYATKGILAQGTSYVRSEGTFGSSLFGATGVGAEMGKDGATALFRSVNGGAYAPVGLAGSTAEIRADSGALSATFNNTGLDLVAGDVFKIAGTQVVGPRGAAVANPAGGATVDAEARTAIDAILARLEAHGLIEA
jgi:hypothetical protein